MYIIGMLWKTVIENKFHTLYRHRHKSFYATLVHLFEVKVLKLIAKKFTKSNAEIEDYEFLIVSNWCFYNSLWKYISLL